MAHQYDHHNLDTDSSDDDMLLNDKKSSMDSKRSPKKKVTPVKYKGFVISNTRTKPTKTSPKKYKKPTKSNTFMKCHECGLWCKGLRGIKMHINKAHKQEFKHDSDTSQSGSMLVKTEPPEQSNIDRLNSSDDDLFPCIKKSPFGSAGSSNVQNNDFIISNINRNSKPTKMSDKKLDKNVSKPIMFIKCRECGMLCSGTKGIKMHTNMVHKIEYKDTSQVDSVFENIKQPEQIKIKSEPDNASHSNLFPNNEFMNLNLNTQPGLFGEMPQINSVVTLGNQPNVQLLSVPGNQNVKILTYVPKDILPSDIVLGQQPVQSRMEFVQENAARPILLPQTELFDKACLNNTLNVSNHPNEVIPKFEHNSESYKRWLRKFVSKCKEQKYPLSRKMCNDINHVLDELSSAIGNPVGFENMKTCHYVYLRLHRILSEVMTGQMRHSLLQ